MILWYTWGMNNAEIPHDDNYLSRHVPWCQFLQFDFGAKRGWIDVIWYLFEIFKRKVNWYPNEILRHTFAVRNKIPGTCFDNIANQLLSWINTSTWHKLIFYLVLSIRGRNRWQVRRYKGALCFHTGNVTVLSWNWNWLFDLYICLH